MIKKRNLLSKIKGLERRLYDRVSESAFEDWKNIFRREIGEKVDSLEFKWLLKEVNEIKATLTGIRDYLGLRVGGGGVVMRGKHEPTVKPHTHDARDVLIKTDEKVEGS